MYVKVDSDFEKAFKITDFPLNVAVEPSTYCNLNCIMCNNNELTRDKGNLNILLYKKIVDEIAKESPNTRLWLDFYGEPLIVKYKLYYMIDYAKKKGLNNININSNGLLMDEEMAEMLLDSGVSYLSFDCDGFSKECYERIRVNGDRDIFYRNVEYILRRKKELGLDKPIIEVKIIEMDENKEEVQQVMDYWKERGAWTACRRKGSWKGEGFDDDISKEKRIACGHAVGQLVFTWDGYAVNCGFDGLAAHTYGNVCNESIKAIWNRRNELLVKPHLEHQFDAVPELCRNCGNWKNIGEERFDENGVAIDKNYKVKEKMM